MYIINEEGEHMEKRIDGEATFYSDENGSLSMGDGVIEDLWVDVTHRGQGIARRLIEEAIKDGATAVLVEPTEAAISFWAHFTGRDPESIGDVKGENMPPYILYL